MPHCVSSRYVLSHYSKCKDHVCPVCGPVREAIRRNFERSKEVVKLSSSSTNVSRPSDGNGNNNNNMQGFSYPGTSTGGDYALEFGSGFANGFASNPISGNIQPQIEANVGPPVIMQKIVGKKAKKEKPEKLEKRDGSEGPPAKKIRSTSSAKATASTTVPVQGQVGNGHISGAPDNNMMNNFNNENMKPYVPYIAQGSQIQQNQLIPNNSIQSSIIVPVPKALSIFPLDPVSCALYNFSAENVNDHFKHIHEGMKITTCRYVHLQESDKSNYF